MQQVLSTGQSVIPSQSRTCTWPLGEGLRIIIKKKITEVKLPNQASTTFLTSPHHPRDPGPWSVEYVMAEGFPPKTGLTGVTVGMEWLLSSPETSPIWSEFQSFTKHTPHKLFQTIFTYLGLKSCRWTKHRWPQKEKKSWLEPSLVNTTFPSPWSPGFNPLASDVATQQNILN